nr:MAG TPA: hypothetical protein [Caudoviricetes sp.]
MLFYLSFKFHSHMTSPSSLNIKSTPESVLN